jgi:hypothetical protein
MHTPTTRTRASGRDPHGLFDHARNTDGLEDHQRPRSVGAPPGIDGTFVAWIDHDVATEVLGETPAA